MTTPLVTNESAFGAVIETTAGVASTIGASQGFLTFDAEVINTTPFIKRKPNVANLGSFKGVTGIAKGTCKGWVELRGKGAAGDVPAWATNFLEAGGFSLATSTFTLSSDTSTRKTASVAKYLNDTRTLGYGFNIGLGISGVVGEILKAEFDGHGLVATTTDTTIITPTFEASVPIICQPGIIALASYIPVFTKWELKTNPRIVMREGQYAWISDFEPTLTLEFERDLAANYDPTTLYNNGTTQNVVITCGAATHNIVTITAANAQFSKPPEPTDREGIAMWSVEMQLNHTAATDDALTIAFS